MANKGIRDGMYHALKCIGLNGLKKHLNLTKILQKAIMKTAYRIFY